MTGHAPGTPPVAAPSRREPRADANGTAWRLRSLIAMGHDSARIARALQVDPSTIRAIVSGRTRTVTLAFRVLVCQLWDTWWDKTPPQHTPAQRRAAAAARRQAQAHSWPAGAGLDEELLDEPWYRPWSRYRLATGTGTAPDFNPSPARPVTARRIA